MVYVEQNKIISIKDSAMTSCQKKSYLHFNRSIRKSNEIQKWQGNVLQSVNAEQCRVLRKIS